MDNYAEWQEPDATSITVEQLDALVKEYREKREIYDKAKKESGELYKEYQEAENKLLSTLKAAGKKSYKVDGIGSVSLRVRNVVRVPGNLEAKRELFKWIESTYGVDFRDEMVSINHQKLNGFYNEEMEKHKNDPLFSIPGVEAPTAEEGLSFRRE